MSEAENIWDFFSRREAEIITLRAELKNELDDLRRARSAVERGRREQQQESNSPKMTIKDMVRSVLAEHPEGGTYDQIIHWISAAHQTDVARTSLSPQLSRLKADSELELDEDKGIWKLLDVKANFNNLATKSRHWNSRALDQKVASQMAKKHKFYGGGEYE